MGWRPGPPLKTAEKTICMRHLTIAIRNHDLTDALKGGRAT
jgi:hypothetical protein